jgi:copper chaperone CopZ
VTQSWKLRMAVGGVTSEGCWQRVERALQRVGARSVRIDPRRGRAVFAFAGDTWEVLSHAVGKAGYQPGRIVVVEGKVPARSAGGCCGVISTEGRAVSDQ